MKELIKKFYKKHSLWVISILISLMVGMVAYFNHELKKKQRKIDEIDFTDTTGTYHKTYYETKFKELKKVNKELYDSLKEYKDKIDYIIQFKATHSYSTGKVIIKEIIDTVYADSTKVPRTFEYANTINNDTMQYKLKINSSEEPNWYSLDIKTSNKYTIVNKEYENGMNQVTIGTNNGTDISNVTVFKKEKKKSFLDRFTIGPSVTTGYDLINKQWGVMGGVSVTYDLK